MQVKLGASASPTVPAVTETAPTPETPREFPWAIAYGIGAGLLGLRWLVGLAGLLQLRRKAAPTEAPNVWRTNIAVPATYGHTILVPEDSAEWPASRLEAAILHERAHIRRGDWLWQTLTSALVVAHWFNPFVWLLAKQLRDTAEVAADDAVLAEGVTPSAYARELIAVAAKVGPTGPALAMARKGGVKDRVVAILAETCDRRLPSRRASFVLASLLAVSGLAVAGLAQKVAGEKKLVRLADVREVRPMATTRWDGKGLPVATPAEVAGDSMGELGFPPRNTRRTSIRFKFDRFLESEEVQVIAQAPARVVTYGKPRLDGQPGEGRQDGTLGLVLDTPLNATHALLHVGRASGAYTVYKGSKVPFTATDEPITWPEGTFPGAKIALKFPRNLKDLDYRVVVVTGKGRVSVRSNEYEYSDDKDDVPTVVYIAVDHPSNVLGVEIEYRKYVDTLFDVPLHPRTPIVPPAVTESKHSIELVRLSEGEKSWLPDGTPSTSLGSIISHLAAGPDERKLTLAFRITGKAWSKGSLYVNVGEGYATMADFNGFLEVKGKPDQRIGIATFNVPKSQEVSPVTVVVNANPWILHADMTVGSGKGEAKIQRLSQSREQDGRIWVKYKVTLDGIASVDSQREIDFNLLDKDNVRLMSVTDPKKKGVYYVRSQDPITRVILESRLVDRATFQGVHLRPNP